MKRWKTSSSRCCSIIEENANAIAYGMVEQRLAQLRKITKSDCALGHHLYLYLSSFQGDFDGCAVVNSDHMISRERASNFIGAPQA